MQWRNAQPHRRDQHRRPGWFDLLQWPCFPLLLVLSGLGGALLSCSGDTTGPAPLSPTQAYWELRLNAHAVNMAAIPPYNTVQLTATALNAAGTPLTDVGTVQYSDQDSSVAVSSTGLVTAHFVTQGQPTQVIASLTVQGVTLMDTALVQVTDTAPQHPLATFSLQPAAGDSAKCAFPAFGGVCTTLPVYAADAVGGTLRSKSTNQILVYFTSSDPTIATIDRSTGDITAIDTGQVTFYATTLAYGIAKRDSLQYVIGNPLFAIIHIEAHTQAGRVTPVLLFEPPVVTVGVAGLIAFSDQVSLDSVDVIFDDSTAVVGGNIPVLAADTLGDAFIVRQFPTPGTYTYHSRKFGTGGTIIVR